MIDLSQAAFNRRSGGVPPRNLVLTPGGYRDESLVHYVPPGHHVRHRKSQIQIVDRKSRRIWQRHERTSTDTPIPGLGSGWVTYAKWENPDQSTISQIATTWVVPPPPAAGDQGQTIFIFNGLQNFARSNLLQAVLQWGSSQAGGGGYWSISNWYINDAGQVFHSDSLQMPSGEVLTATVGLGQEIGDTCTYTVGFQGYAFLDLSVAGVDRCRTAVEVLEAYQVGDCAEYPSGSTKMSSIAIAAGGQLPSLLWVTQNNPGDCGERTSVINGGNPNGELEIIY